MPYSVTLTNGSVLTTVQDGTVDSTSSSLTLIGKNYAGYGVFLNENFVELLENFSNGSAPNKPLTGQLWYDNINDTLKVWNSAFNLWKPIGSSISQSTAPSAATSVTGDLWWNTATAQLNVWSGSAWITIGPAYTSTAGTSGAVVQTILDTSGQSHVVVIFYISNAAIAILSKDATFTPGTAIAGFATIIPGFNLISASSLTGAQYTGTVSSTGITTFNNLPGSAYLTTATTGSFSTAAAVSMATGSTVGSDLQFVAAGSGAAAYINETVSGKNLSLTINSGGTTRTLVTLGASNQLVTIANLSVSGVGTTGLTVANIILPSGTVNIGSSTNQFANIYAAYLVGTSVTAQYADLAERFKADAVYAPGTVVALGGVNEITAAAEDLTEDVFGVISTRAAYLMNGSAGSDDTHPAVAVQGRVPVRVTGVIRKGDRLVSAGSGLARSAARTEITAFNVIGRSLEDKTTAAEGVVEAIVKLNS